MQPRQSSKDSVMVGNILKQHEKKWKTKDNEVS